MHVTMWEHCTFANQIFGYGRVYCPYSNIITNLVYTLFSSFSYENVFSIYFRVEIYQQHFHMEFSDFIKYINAT
jgi:hypothetical protein